jgi:hypothetical protein
MKIIPLDQSKVVAKEVPAASSVNMSEGRDRWDSNECFPPVPLPYAIVTPRLQSYEYDQRHLAPVTCEPGQYPHQEFANPDQALYNGEHHHQLTKTSNPLKCKINYFDDDDDDDDDDFEQPQVGLKVHKNAMELHFARQSGDGSLEEKLSDKVTKKIVGKKTNNGTIVSLQVIFAGHTFHVSLAIQHVISVL